MLAAVDTLLDGGWGIGEGMDGISIRYLSALHHHFLRPPPSSLPNRHGPRGLLLVGNWGMSGGREGTTEGVRRGPVCKIGGPCPPGGLGAT